MSTEPTLVSLVNKTVEQANFSTGSDQLKWIEEDLAHVDRCKTPWVILGGHRPMYIDSTYGGNPASDLVRAGRFSKYEEQGQNIHVLVYVAFTNILCALLLSLSLCWPGCYARASEICGATACQVQCQCGSIWPQSCVSASLLIPGGKVYAEIFFRGEKWTMDHT